MPAVADRCSGHCCRAFTLPFSPDEFARIAWAELHDGAQFFTDDGEPRGPFEDGFQVATMLLHLGVGGVPPGGIVRRDTDGDRPDSHWYTCRNFDASTGNCRIYDRRPRLCRDYPGGSSYAAMGCGYTDCTWAAARLQRAATVMGERVQIAACEESLRTGKPLADCMPALRQIGEAPLEKEGAAA